EVVISGNSQEPGGDSASSQPIVVGNLHGSTLDYIRRWQARKEPHHWMARATTPREQPLKVPMLLPIVSCALTSGAEKSTSSWTCHWTLRCIC
ncbi:unnamed protein product, partial [Chrysoparadoxa australica]